MKYDDASWHYACPDDLPDEAGATHAGLFLAWAILCGLGSSDWQSGWFDIEAFRDRRMSPVQAYLMVDGKFTDEDLTDEGNAFAAKYFDFETGQFLNDYERLFGRDIPTLYHVVDSWENLDQLKTVLDERLDEWRKAQSSPTGSLQP